MNKEMLLAPDYVTIFIHKSLPHVLLLQISHRKEKVYLLAFTLDCALYLPPQKY